jgi:O-antigen/teichoic acid export membrane protein
MSGASKSAQSLFVGGIISKVVTFAGAIILARIILPEDFGYFVSVSIITGFLTMFSISGYETYYIQNRDITDEEDREVLGSVFRLRAIQSAILFALQIAVGIYFLFYRDPVTGKMLIITSFIHLFWIIGKPAEAHYSKNLNFKPIVKANIGRDIFAVIIKISAGLAGLGPYSLALGVVGGNLYRQLSISMQAKLKLGFKYNRAYTKAAIIFGRSELISTAGSYLKSYSDKIILSSFYTKTQIGLFDFAKSQAETVNLFFLYPQNGLVLSYISKHKKNPERLKEIFSGIGILSNNIIVPSLLYVFFASDLLVPFVLGAKWVGSVVYLKIFVVQSIVTLLLYPSSGIFSAIGLPQLKSKISIFFTVFSVAILTAMAYKQLDLVLFALVFVGVNVVYDLVVCLVSMKKIHISFLQFIKLKISGITLWIVLIAGWIILPLVDFSNILTMTAYFIIVAGINLKYFSKNKILGALTMFLGAEHRLLLVLKRVL